MAAPASARPAPVPCRPRRRATHDAAYTPIATALVAACTMPTRLSRDPAADHSAHPAHAVGATARRPVPTSLWAAADDSRPPKRSSTVAEVQVPRTTSVSTGWIE